eukprot:jgi/Bigna1/128716/aug1.7_g3424
MLLFLLGLGFLSHEVDAQIAATATFDYGTLSGTIRELICSLGHYNPLNVALGYATPCVPQSVCEIGDLSGKHGQFSAAIVNAEYNDTNLPLFGVNSIVGRSIVIHASGGARMACATIMPDGLVKTVRAGFDGEALLGSVTLMEYGPSNAKQTMVLANVNLQSSYQSRYGDSGPVSWNVYSVHPNATLGFDYLSTGASGGGCDVMENSASVFNTATIGNLTLKHGLLTLGSKSFFTDSNLPLSGANSVGALGLSIGRLGCATIGRHVRAEFDINGVYGYIEMVQASETDTTAVTVSLDGLSDLGNKWHVHEFPIIDGCQSSSVGGHYNPYDVSLGYSTPCIDMSVCEVGDLSGKHVRLSSAAVMQTYNDTNLPLSGKYSVVGRSIVLHRNSDGSRYACATILPTLRFKTIRAIFDTDVRGVMTFSQERFDSKADSWVLADIEHSTSTSSIQHKYHVHVNPTSIDNPTDCGSSVTGGHWNPSMVSNSHCSAGNWSLCEIGDLSGKHDKIAIPSSNSSKVFYTDNTLPLSGAYSIESRSIVIHAANAGAARIACATLGKYARATFPSYGSIDFLQASEYSSSQITVLLPGLPASVTGWEIRSSPSTGGLCDSLIYSPGSLFNPNTTSLDNNAVGALTAKFGNLVASGNFTDANLLFGKSSVVGRSVVLLDGTTIHACSTIEGTLTPSVLRASFSGYDLDGTILIKQPRSDPRSETVVSISLQYSAPHAAAQTVNHKYHVHVNPVDSTQTGTSRCGSASTGGHWNPNAVGNQYCGANEDEWAHCEVGDLSNKHGLLSFPAVGSGRVVYSDNMLPLQGAWLISGRSIVVHAENSGSSRIDCATLEVADPGATFYVTLTIQGDISQVDSSYRSTFKSNLASLMGVPTSDIAIEYSAGSIIASVLFTSSIPGVTNYELAHTLSHLHTSTLSSALAVTVSGVSTPSQAPPTPSPTPTPAPAPSSTKDDEKLDKATLIVIYILMALMVAMLLLMIYFCCRKLRIDKGRRSSLLDAAGRSDAAVFDGRKSKVNEIKAMEMQGYNGGGNV